MIKTSIRLQDDTVMVFDTDGEQVPEYQGRYDNVKENILRDAPPGATFTHWFDYDITPEVISKDAW